MKVQCRARISPDCMHDRDIRQVYGEDGMADDSTWDGHSVVCDACYLRAEPFTRMNAESVPRAVNSGVAHYIAQRDYLAKHPNPQALLNQAKDAAEKSRPGSPSHTSARALVRMAEKELEHRGRPTA